MIVLDAKTDYSFMRGFGSPEEWLARCKEIGVTHFGVADYCSTWGHTFFRKAFKDSGVHLIYGVQLPVVSALDKDTRFSLVTLLATDNLEPLYALVSLAHQQSYYRPRLTWEQVKKFPGIVIVDYALPHHVTKSKGYYVGLNATTPPHMLKIKGNFVPAYGPKFPSSEVRQGFKLFQAVSQGQRIGEVDTDALHMLRQSEFVAMFGSVCGPKENANLAKIVKSCKADIPKGTLIESGIEDKLITLREMAIDGAVKLKLAKKIKVCKGTARQFNDDKYRERLDRELALIHEKNFEDYFFFVADVVTWAKKRMFVGPGRGSAGGSLLCYLLGITTVDPLVHNTMFERFIDITRPDLPDIDIDFPDNRREEVFTYLKEKYGEERVARIGTVSEFGAKSALNDTARASGIPLDVAREIGKYTEGVGQGVTISPARIFGTSERDTMLTPEHYKLVEKYPAIKLATMLNWDEKKGDEFVNVGRPRHHGVHAAGVVVTQGNVQAFGARTKEGTLTMDMRSAEDIGLVKMDVLGLKTLSVIQTACDLAGIKPASLYDLDWADPKVYKLLNDDRVTGLFQLEGHAVRGLMKGVTMERFDDICALTSLARPGPLIGGAAENWVKARRGDIEGRELHPSLETTFGVICYQEQMMAICRDIAGFDEPNVNGMRRAVGKKDPAKLRGYRELFLKGANKWFGEHHPGYRAEDNYLSDEHYEQAKEQAAELWDELCEFGSYAFNLAHAVAYAMISYMAAWLKTNYPLQFAAACLRYAADDEQGKNLLRELKEEGFNYVAFDPQKSAATWSIIDGKLYGGFDSVKGVGEKTALAFEAKRKANPKAWMEELTESQRGKLLAPHNTPWDELTYFGDTYGQLYTDPGEFKRPYAPAGFRGPVVKIRDIPDQKGNYAFLARILRVQKRDMNDETRVAKRDGKVFADNTHFINLQFEDDTGECGGTVNRFKASDFQWLLDQDMSGRDFFIRGNIIGEGRRWIFVDNIVELQGTTK